MNIKAIETMRRAFWSVAVGLSDHVVGDAVAIAAGPAGQISLRNTSHLIRTWKGLTTYYHLPNELRSMIDRFQIVISALGDGIKQPAANEVVYYPLQKNDVCRKDIEPGDLFDERNVMYTDQRTVYTQNMSLWCLVALPRSL